MTPKERNDIILQNLRTLLKAEGFVPAGLTAEKMFHPRDRRVLLKSEYDRMEKGNIGHWVPMPRYECFFKKGTRTGLTVTFSSSHTKVVRSKGPAPDRFPPDLVLKSNEPDTVRSMVARLFSRYCEFVPPERFGESHYTLLDKLVAKCQESRAETITLKKQFIRSHIPTNPDTHASLYRKDNNHDGSRLRDANAYGNDYAGYQAAIKDGAILNWHDGRDCLFDLEAAGMLRIDSLEKYTITMLEPGYRAIEVLTEGHTVEQNDFPEELSRP